MILEADKLSFSFEGGKKVFQDVSFSLEKGEILTILGPNGAGKSTLLNCLANLYRPDSGRILLNGKPLDSYKVRDVAKIMAMCRRIMYLRMLTASVILWSWAVPLILAPFSNRRKRIMR